MGEWWIVVKRIGLSFILAFSLFVMPLTGCWGGKGEPANEPATEGSTTQEPDVQATDKAFLEDLEKGLYARWDLVDATPDTEDEYVAMKSYIEAELSFIAGYKDKVFADADLEAAAKEYIELLQTQSAEIDRNTATEFPNWGEFNTLIERRTSLLKDFGETFGLHIADEYAENYQGLIADADRKFTAETEADYPYPWIDNEVVTIRLPEITPEEYAIGTAAIEEGGVPGLESAFSGVLKNNTNKDIFTRTTNVVVNGVPTEEDFKVSVFTKPWGRSYLDIVFGGQITNISEVYSVDGVLEVRDPATDEVLSSVPFHFDSLSPIKE
jgi:hypothetical protein